MDLPKPGGDTHDLLTLSWLAAESDATGAMQTFEFKVRGPDDPRLAGCPDWMRGVHEDQVRYFSR